MIRGLIGITESEQEHTVALVEHKDPRGVPYRHEPNVSNRPS
jgi:hypothetical protein